MSEEKKVESARHLEAAGKVLEQLREMGFDTGDEPNQAIAVLRLALGQICWDRNVTVRFVY
jgi:hypothetical protein